MFSFFLLLNTVIYCDKKVSLLGIYLLLGLCLKIWKDSVTSLQNASRLCSLFLCLHVDNSHGIMFWVVFLCLTEYLNLPQIFIWTQRWPDSTFTLSKVRITVVTHQSHACESDISVMYRHYFLYIWHIFLILLEAYSAPPVECSNSTNGMSYWLPFLAY